MLFHVQVHFTCIYLPLSPTTDRPKQGNLADIIARHFSLQHRRPPRLDYDVWWSCALMPHGPFNIKGNCERGIILHHPLYNLDYCSVVMCSRKHLISSASGCGAVESSRCARDKCIKEHFHSHLWGKSAERRSPFDALDIFQIKPRGERKFKISDIIIIKLFSIYRTHTYIICNSHRPIAYMYV